MAFGTREIGRGNLENDDFVHCANRQCKPVAVKSKSFQIDLYSP